MKRSILLFSAVAGILFLSLSSYQNGPAISGLTPPNRTGSSGAPTNCSDANCHGAVNALTTVTLGLLDSATGQSGPDHYVGGHTYTVVMTVQTTTPGVTKYGYQATIAKAVNQQAGTISVLNAAQQHLFTAGTITGIEHSTPVQVSTQLTPISFKWKAPPALTGQVKLYAIINAVNGDGQANAADHASTVQINLNEWLTSVSELSKDIKIVAYPNPATNQFSLKFEDAEKGEYSVTVMNMAGQEIYSDNIAVNSTQSGISIDASGWATGLYFAQVMKDGAQRMIPIVKQ